MIKHVDNNLVLPATIFSNPNRAWCQFFIQDAKVDLVRGKIMTCEFGLAKVSAWDKETSFTVQRAVDVLNKHQRLWFFADPSYLRFVNEKSGDDSFASIFGQAMKKNPINQFTLQDPFETLQPLPKTALNPNASLKFDPENIDSYYAIGVSPYHRIPAAHFSKVTEEKEQKNILLLDEGSGVGPCIKVYCYKHISRLIMNGTDAAGQNPPYVLIETAYSSQLAAFLKQRFPDDRKLVLKHVAASRGEGVVMLDATTTESLDHALESNLKEDSVFRKVSPLSICLVESFISTPEVKGSVNKETMVRISYVVTRHMKDVKVNVLSGFKCYAQEPSDNKTQFSGVVKLSKNDGKIEILDDDTLKRIQAIVDRDISCIAQRAVSYDREAAVLYFLSSDNYILNLLGIELFAPFLVCNYRERVETPQGNYNRVSDEQCKLLCKILERSSNPILRERILKTVIMPDWTAGVEKPHELPCGSFAVLFKTLYQTIPAGKLTPFEKAFLISVYQRYSMSPPEEPRRVIFTARMVEVLELHFSTLINTNQLEALFAANMFPVSIHDKNLVLPLKSIPLHLYKKFFEGSRNEREQQLRLFPITKRIEIEEPYKKNWNERDQVLFFENYLPVKSLSQKLLIALALPELLNLGWSVGQTKDIFESAFKHPSFEMNQANMYYVLLLRSLAQLKGIDSDLSYQFFASMMDYQAHAPCYKQLKDHIQTEVLSNNRDVNEVLKSLIQGFRDHRTVNSDLSFEAFYNAVLMITTKK